jgi:LysR family transcriptional regulator, hydrogen peroxide-inducible genes activator
VTLVQLRYAVAVDAHRHFGQAAAACAVSQPTLSMQLRKLERELGVALFDRSRQPVEPTDLGRLIIAQARAALREAARIGELAAGAGQELTGQLRIGVLATLAPYLLPRFVAELPRRYPGLSLWIGELQTEQILEQLVTDRLDAGLVATPAADPGLVEQPLFREPFVGYVSGDHRLHRRRWLDPGDLGIEDLWLLNEGHCFRDQVLSVCGDARSRQLHSLPLRFESGNLETLKRLVDSSGGMTLLPALAVAEISLEDRRHVRRFRAPPPERVIRLVHPAAYLKRGLIGAFVDELLRVIPRELRLAKPATVRAPVSRDG